MKVTSRSAGTAAGVVAVAALIPLGLSACTVVPPRLACSAAPTSTRPAQNTVDTIIVKTVAGATVTTRAAYKTATYPLTTAANALGIARVAYRVATAEPGFRIKVTVAVAKGKQTGSCATAFTPAGPVSLPAPDPVPVKPPPPAPLTAVITPLWQGPGLGVALPVGGQNSFSSPGACQYLMPGFGNPCGGVRVDALISGFSAYGDIPACPAGAQCFNEPGARLSGSATVSWQTFCPTSGIKYSNSQLVSLGVIYPGVFQTVNSFTRVDANSARVSLAYDIQAAKELNQCSAASIMLSTTVTNVALHLDGTGTAYPSSDFFAAGPFERPRS